jgi:hypothetical protein
MSLARTRQFESLCWCRQIWVQSGGNKTSTEFLNTLYLSCGVQTKRASVVAFLSPSPTTRPSQSCVHSFCECAKFVEGQPSGLHSTVPCGQSALVHFHLGAGIHFAHVVRRSATHNAEPFLSMRIPSNFLMLHGEEVVFHMDLSRDTLFAARAAALARATVVLWVFSFGSIVEDKAGSLRLRQNLRIAPIPAASPRAAPSPTTHTRQAGRFVCPRPDDQPRSHNSKHEARIPPCCWNEQFIFSVELR